MELAAWAKMILLRKVKVVNFVVFNFQGVYPLIDGLELSLYDLRYSIDMLNTTSIQLFLLTNQIMYNTR